MYDRLVLQRADDLTVIASAKEWCVAETGGVVLVLLLTSMRTAWLADFTQAVLDGAARCKGGCAPLLSVFRLDKRYPVDIGFKGNLSEIGEAHRTLAPFTVASSVVVEFEGILAASLRAAIAGLEVFSLKKYPQSVHKTLISGASWIVPHVAEESRRDVMHYVDALNRMKSDLGCEL